MTAAPNLPHVQEANMFSRILGFEASDKQQQRSGTADGVAANHQLFGSTSGACSLTANISQSPPGGLTLTMNTNSGYVVSQTSSSRAFSSYTSPSQTPISSQLGLLRSRYDVEQNQLSGLFRSHGEEDLKASSGYTCGTTTKANSLHSIMFGVSSPADLQG